MPNLDAGALIEKHRARGVLVNSNLLVLLLVSQVDPRQIWQFTRTENFTGDDFRLLASLIAWFGKLITPHVLAQLSDLTDEAVLLKAPAHGCACLTPHALPPGRIVGQSHHGRRESRRIAKWHEGTDLAAGDDVADGANVSTDGRHAGGHRFDQRDWCAFIP